MPSGPPLVEMEGVFKSFGGVHALVDVGFTLLPGEVHGLMGENGAGKSTLMKILSGSLRQDRGVIRIDGRPLEIGSPRRAQSLGIALVPQELDILPHLSVMENVWFGRYPRQWGGTIDWAKLRAMTEALFDRLSASISPTAIVGELSVADRQLVAIARGLSLDARVLILDEPTSSLTPREVRTLMSVIEALKAQGAGIIFISHHLPEVLDIADRVTVLRDGRSVGTKDRRDLDPQALVEMMLGQQAETLFRKEPAEVGRPCLVVKDLTVPGRVYGASLTVRAGEIVGVAGLLGAGRSELAHAIFGSLPRSSGAIEVDGQAVDIRSPRDAVRAGIALLPEDRQHQGLLVRMSIRENTTLAVLRRVTEGVRIRRRKEVEATREQIRQLDIRATGTEQVVNSLSGGNQQKVALGKWLLTGPRVLILDEPTRGIDVGAKAQIHRLMTRLAKDGVGIVLISSDLPEVLGLSDRVVVMRRGRIVRELSREEATAERTMLAATGGDTIHGKTVA